MFIAGLVAGFLGGTMCGMLVAVLLLDSNKRHHVPDIPSLPPLPSKPACKWKTKVRYVGRGRLKPGPFELDE